MPTFRAVLFDETRHVNLPALGGDAKHFRSLHSVYVYDPARVTHCCELTPSYDLRFAYSDAVCDLDAPEDARERIDEAFLAEGGDDMYVWCSNVERVAKQVDVEADDLDAAREYLMGNHIL